jgi:dTDP-4-dehydrorhamnose reductase
VDRIVITGARGQLGLALRRVLADREPIALAHEDLDIADGAAVDRRLREIAPRVVLNAAAFNRVDDAEERSEDVYRVNAEGPRALARACRHLRALFVHFSTDYVFSGDASEPYGEEDAPRPRSVYAASKLAGEQAVAGETALHMVIRTCGLFGMRTRGGKGTNFVDTVLRVARERSTIRVVDDQHVAPTAAVDLARKTAELLERWSTTAERSLLGLYHVTNAGSCSWYEFAREIVRLSGVELEVEPISTAQYGARAPRPAYSVLAHGHLARLGLDDLRPWNAALAEYLAGTASP